MRVFLPSTLPALAEVLRAGQVGSDPGPQPGYAVTPALREAYASGDQEELEYAALTEAARRTSASAGSVEGRTTRMVPQSLPQPMGR